MNKIPIGIKSCEKNSERQTACRNTWIDTLDKEKYLPLFLIGRKNQPSEIVGDILYLDCEDSYEGLSGKTKAYYKWALDNTEVSHFWSCDDDSYINYNNFNNFEEYKNYDYIGSFIYGIDKINNIGGYASGCGMCVSRAVAEFCSIYLPDIAEYEDLAIGTVLNENEHVWSNIKKFDPHTIQAWSFCTYHPTLLIGHYIQTGEGSLSTFTESMHKMHSLYTKKKKIEHIYKHDNFGEDWFTYPKFYSDIVNKYPSGSHFVEIGSWKGKSSSYMVVEILNSNKNIKFDCVDTWHGSAEHGGVYSNNNTLYDIFTENMKSLKEYHNPIRMSSVDASKMYKDASLDFVFIDASHEYEHVKEDISCWLPKLKSGGTIAGHDYPGWDGVKKSVDEKFSQVIQRDECWVIDII